MKKMRSRMAGMDGYTKLFIKWCLSLCNAMLLSSAAIFIYASVLPFGPTYISLLNHSDTLRDMTLPVIFFAVFGAIAIEEICRRKKED